MSDLSDDARSPSRKKTSKGAVPSYEDAHRAFHLAAGVAEADIPPCICDPDHKDVELPCDKPPVSRVQCINCAATDPDVVMYTNQRYPGRKFFKARTVFHFWSRAYSNLFLV
ncbi:hypothetical protein AURDEDRAFT_178238 [Auricularia subglabra TFB-10046 SS5]|uniref:Uncharacterized protein n=1 Tax=Auricularia subglabra (strain TFB-10046 / SS5) TaxID=717982 RepID=J0D226_AURST|nr:hypothetical protein AURDEDRAFT_178238 [Auricularia subglabra TFB-10046 SS5]